MFKKMNLKKFTKKQILAKQINFQEKMFLLKEMILNYNLLAKDHFPKFI